MAAPANTGLNKNPKNGYKTPAAIGIPNELYTNAPNKFCFIRNGAICDQEFIKRKNVAAGD